MIETIKNFILFYNLSHFISSFDARSYSKFLHLWTVMAISRVSQRPLLVIEKDLSKIAAL